MSSEHPGAGHAPHDKLADPDYAAGRAPYFSDPLTPLEPRAGAGTRELLLAMANAGGPVRHLGQVYVTWEEMTRLERQAVWMTIAGAYVPFGLGPSLRALINHQLLDVLVTTPAQLTHDLSEIRGDRFYHSSDEVDDNELQRLDVLRYWDTVSDEHDLNSNEDVTFPFLDTLAADRPYTPAELFYRLGLWLERSGVMKTDGILTSAARNGVPIFCPSPADADLSGNIAHYRKRTGRKLTYDPVKEALDMVALNAATEDAGGRAGLVTLGGGAPRNYGQQAMACAYMLDRRDLKKYNYGVRISLDPVQTGGLSGSTISEAKTWKKYSPDAAVAEYFGDFMAPLVQVTSALLEAFQSAPRRPFVRVSYADDGRLLATVDDQQRDVQALYGYA